MNRELLLANLNLYAVLPRLQQIVQYDEEAKSICKDWNFTLQFSVSGGPLMQLQFNEGKCIPHRGKVVKPNIILYFNSPEKLNAMFSGEKVTPLPIKGVFKIMKIQKDFEKLTQRLEYYMKPDEEAIKDKKVFEVNVECTLYTVVHAIKEVAEMDPRAKSAAHHLPDGSMQLKILPNGPSAYLEIKNHTLYPGIGEIDNPRAMMTFENMQIAYDLFNNKIDAFAALGLADVKIKGFVPIAETINNVLGRLPLYLEN